MARKPNRVRRIHGVAHLYLREMDSGEKWWWAHFPGIGRRALGFPEAEAETAAERFRELSASGGRLPDPSGETGPSPEEATLGTLSAKYLAAPHGWKPRTLAGNKLLVTAFVEALGTEGVVRASQITDPVLDAWIRHRMDDEVDPGTINRGLVAARCFLRWCAEQEPPLCALTPIERRKNLRELDRQPHPLIPSPTEWRQLVGALSKLGEGEGPARGNARGIALLVLVAVQTGERLDELRHMREEDVHRDAIAVNAWGDWSPKGWQERTIPVPETVSKLALEFVTWRDRAVGANGRKLSLGEHWINDRLDAAWRTLGVSGEPPRMHDARRTFVTEIVRAGHGINVARERAGHRDIATTERYVGKYRSDAAVVVPDMGLAGVLDGPAGSIIPFGKRR